MDLHVIVLAAGKGTRMKSARPKVLHHVGGRPMIEHVLDRARELGATSTVVVIGHQASDLKEALASHRDLTFVVQEPQRGTAHALLTAEPSLGSAKGTAVLLSGDVPLLAHKTLESLINSHRRASAAMTVLTADVERPHGYGRIVRSGEKIARIVEEKDATPAERDIREINSGIYAFELDGLFDAVRTIASQNAQGEYYLPDLVAIYRGNGRGVETVSVADSHEILGINSRADLAAMNHIVRHEKNTALMASGVTLEDPATTYIDPDVEIGADTIIHPGVSIERGTVIGQACEIHSGARIIDSRLGDRVTILNHCVIAHSHVDHDASIGPFAHLRNHVAVGAHAKVGNFVEMKNTKFGEGSKSGHLAYLGDAV
ncbi:MAG TPA: bifunctional UDP-N-acetylglucosamine diphosphorylase/glucosamine-1-phosphate N-acetyltransferase GlmU, partial [Gemmatimonadaceae bacterium]|nr:bifunctional UDP-N-acetylglucosamine diphosphorylase/glucosamine-1-phosphate N-acetyltransferase GlmU [Gemmatimonadaceae bacterium]